MPAALKPFARQRGFTMVELIMVIVIMGVIGGIMAVFMKSPIDAYFASARRAGLTDVADTVVRRMSRDIRKALPNSIRTPNSQCVEFIPTKTGGRYRADDTPEGLSFSVADASFNMLRDNSHLLGSTSSVTAINTSMPVDQQIAVGDVIVVYNLGIPGADAYLQDNTAAVVNPAPSESGTPVETKINIAAKLFPLASSSNRFYVVAKDEKVVSYVCNSVTGNLHRTVNATDFSGSCPATGPVLARHVSACNFDYSGSDLQRNALIRMLIQLTESDETVSLQHEVNVNNSP